MKKIEFVFFVLLISLIFVSCEKEIEKVSQGNVKSLNIEKRLEGLDVICVKVENNTLNFETEEDFQKCINLFVNNDYSKLDEFEGNLDFLSYRSLYKSGMDKCPVNDPVFAAMLNLKKQIIIENFLFTLDFNNRKIEVKSCAAIDQPVRRFSFDDDVFAIVKNESILKSTTTDYCGQENVVHNFSGGVTTSVDYNKYGVYFSLVSKIMVAQDFVNYLGQRTVNSPYVIQQTGHPISEYDYNLVVPTGINSRCFFKRSGYQNEIIYDRYITHDNELTVTPYKNSRRLVGFRFDVEYTWQFDVGGLFGYDHLMIQCHQY